MLKMINKLKICKPVTLLTIQTWADSDADFDEISKLSGLSSGELICRILWYYVMKLTYTYIHIICIYIHILDIHTVFNYNNYASDDIKNYIII